MSVRKMSEIELKPCPFCGGEAILYKEEIPDGKISYHTARIKCDNCGCATRQYIIDGYYGSTDTVEDCISTWNNRKQNNTAPVVLCKDCKYYRKMYKLCSCRSDKFNVYLNDNDFCSFGERMTDNG